MSSSTSRRIGKLLYACLTSRWPGAHVDGLKAAPTEHGRLLRPRQVRAGVSRDVDTTCDRILGTPPRNHATPLRKAADIARTLRLSGEDDELLDDQPSLASMSSPDLLRLDPVIVPEGPPPGLEPPRRRPKAYEPAPPTTLERGKERARRAARGDRGLVLLGLVGALVIASVLAFLVGRSTNDSADPIERSSPLRILPIQRVGDFDPQSDDNRENPEEARLAIDDELSTGWRTSTYLGSPELGGLKDGVGLVLDLGGPRDVDSLRVRLAGAPTSLSIYASDSTATKVPRSLRELAPRRRPQRRRHRCDRVAGVRHPHPLCRRVASVTAGGRGRRLPRRDPRGRHPRPLLTRRDAVGDGNAQHLVFVETRTTIRRHFMSDSVRNLIIIGSGPSGYTAAVYAARANLEPLVFEGSVTAGGALMNTTDVENFPGFPDGIMGPDLMDKLRAQAERFGAELVSDDVTAVDLTSEIKTVSLADGTTYRARAVVLAMGSGYRKLEVEGEDRLSGSRRVLVRDV